MLKLLIALVGVLKHFFKKPQMAIKVYLELSRSLKPKFNQMWYWSKISHVVVTWAIKVFLFKHKH